MLKPAWIRRLVPEAAWVQITPIRDKGKETHYRKDLLVCHLASSVGQLG